jgi:cytochrome c biogenesis protein
MTSADQPAQRVEPSSAPQGRVSSRSPLDPLGRIGGAAWGLLTNVSFAVLLIILLAISGLVGMLVRQFPITAASDPARYAAEIATMHRAWDGIQPFDLPLGSFLVDTFDWVGLFSVFSSPWFLLLMSVLTISIIVCTLDRTPRLWQSVRDVRVDQPEPFFDTRLEHRAVLTLGPRNVTDATDAVAGAFRARGFRRQRRSSADGVTIVFGDRNQYMKMATLLTHTGLVLFLLGGAVTVALGFETVVFVGEGQTAPVQRVGTRNNLLVKNHTFEAPQRADGSFVDYSTDLSVFRDGEEIARKTIRVNDPLTVDGFVFHQNTFGPSAELTIHDAAGQLVWTGPMLLAEELLDRPQGFMTIPGSNVGLLALLNRGADGAAQLVLQGVGPPSTQTGEGVTIFLATLPVGATTDPDTTAGHAITWDAVGAWTGMVIKNDPGQPIIWVAFGLLIAGLMLTFYFPRRRAWARIDDQHVRLAFIADRYVDGDGEFRRLRETVDDLVEKDSPDRGGASDRAGGAKS